MPKHPSIYIYYILLFVAFGLTSCSQKSTENRDHLVFRYNQHANISSLDPAFSRNLANIWPSLQLYNGLVQFDEELNLKPDIAKRWEFNDSTNTYTFFLRDDVYFHKDARFGKDSTRTVTAHDFVFSFDRLLDPDLASPGSWVLQQVARYKAVNDTVFQIELKESFPPFLGLMAMPYCSVVPKEIIHSNETSFRNNPVGTGPFAFKFWEENVKLVLRKNPIYFEKDSLGNSLPYLEAVAVTFLPDKQSGFLQFVQGKSDFISGLDASYKDDILTPRGELQPKYQDKIKILSGAYLNTEYLGFKLDNPTVLADKRIRLALNYGFDRQKMVTYLRNNMGTAATNGFVPLGLQGRFENGFQYDYEKAKTLVEEYKKENNNPVRITLSTNASYLDIAEYLQREWQKIGIEVAIDVMPNSALRQGMATGKVDFFRGSWIADYPDAENYFSLFYSPNYAPNGPNYTHFKNEMFDLLYEKSFMETDDEKRFDIYRKMDSIIVSEAPVIPLFYDKAIRFTSKKVDNLGVNPLNLLQLKKVKKSE